MTVTRGRSRGNGIRRLLSAVMVTAGVALSGCSSTGGFSATAICERSGGEYVGHTCQHHSTPQELAAQQWCQTHGGVYSDFDGCVWGFGGP
jgi:hypothetical protein